LHNLDLATFYLTEKGLSNNVPSMKTKRAIRFCMIFSATAFAYPGEALAGRGTMTQTNDDKVVHVETYVHVAFPPTQYDIDQIKEKLRRSARMICDATDGKVLIDKIHLERNGQSANNADVLWLPEGQISRYITSTGGNRFGHPVAHFRVSNEVAFRAVAHEFGHLLFRLGDQYDRQRYFPNSGCGIGPSIQDTDVTVTNHSIMQEYDTICRIKASGDLTTTTCNYDLDCEEPFEECYEFSPEASEFNTNNPTFERIRGDTDDGVAWPGISKGEKLWLDSRLYVDLTANWTWADRSSSSTRLATSRFNPLIASGCEHGKLRRTHMNSKHTWGLLRTTTIRSSGA
jgi:hypothetical protein